jgi:hypothetical protein
MALQSSGAISISQIRNEQVNNGGFGSTYSLRTLSSNASKSTPDAMSEFYSYNAAHNVNINFYYPGYVGCYNGYYFQITSSEAVNANFTATVYWYGDLGGAFQGSVTIYSGNTCGSNNIYSGGTNCYGENYSSYNYYFTPSSSGNQNYVFNSIYIDYPAPC